MNNIKDKLYSVAEGQQGYFTAKQAAAAGYTRMLQNYHTKTGAWVREHRGIYRLAQFPLSPEGQYVLWSLWSCDRKSGMPQGVYSHQTALSMHGLSDVMPKELHMTVPRGFRRSAPLPKALFLHQGDAAHGDTEARQGYRVMRPLPALVAVMNEGSESRDRLAQALQQALQRGLITRAELTSHPNKRELEQLLA